MADVPDAGLAEGERVVLRLKPAWRSFCDHYLVAVVLAAVALKDAFRPEVGQPFPLPPLLTLALAAAVLVYVVLKRQTNEYIVTDRRLRRVGLGGRQRDLELVRVGELKVSQPTTQRLMGTGKVVASQSDDFTGRVRFFGVEEPEKVREAIAKLIEEAKR
jgi:hypothetical protein